MATPKVEVHGVLVVDKPTGMTSHDVVGRVRRIVGQKSVGHAGTLDPMASGVLVVLLGEATKLTPWLTSDAKTYTCTLQLGVETASGDADGALLRDVPLTDDLLTAMQDFDVRTPAGAIANAATQERLRTEQVPPAVSAIHVDGERAYERVRRGEVVELPPRPVHVDALVVDRVDLDARAIVCTLQVSKGYYVRAFARDFAAALGTLAHLTALRRTHSGAFTLTDAVALDGLTREAAVGALHPCELAIARALPCRSLSEDETRWARQGKRFPWPESLGTGAHAWLGPDGYLVAVGEGVDGFSRVTRGFFATPPKAD